LFKGDTKPDFVIFVRFTSLDDCDIYVVPAKVVDALMVEVDRTWHKYPKRDGSERKYSRHTAFSWAGKPTAVGRGLATTWEEYKDAWHLLDN
jgi:hypothetical protein